MSQTKNTNLIDLLDTSSSQASSEVPQVCENEQRVFLCNFCQRKFNNLRALGGHQNSHKGERNLAKRVQRLRTHMMASSVAYGHPYFQQQRQFSRKTSVPVYDYSSRNLGIEAHSMIHKPYRQNPVGYGHMHKNYSRSSPLADQQPGVGRLDMTRTNFNFSREIS